MYEEYLKQLEAVLDAGLLPTLISEIPSILIDVAAYIFTALALYTIAKRRGIQKPWLAWIPVVNVWVLGCISDQYRDVALGQVKYRRKTLLWLNIVMAALCAMILVAVLIVFSEVALLILTNMTGTEEMKQQVFEVLNSTLPLLASMALAAIPLIIVAVFYCVFYYTALHDLFKSCDPASATLFTVLSILIGISLPVFLFLCRNKDEGMPPRQPASPEFLDFYQP